MRRATMMMVLLLAAPAVVLADDATTPYVQELARSIGAVVQVLVLALAGLVLDALRRKFGIDASGMADARVRALAQQAGAYAEELSAGRLKSASAKLDPEVKLREAVDWLRRRMPSLTEAEARELVLAGLPFVGAGAARKPTAEPRDSLEG